jgi:hypothetical protein
MVAVNHLLKVVFDVAAGVDVLLAAAIVEYVIEFEGAEVVLAVVCGHYDLVGLVGHCHARVLVAVLPLLIQELAQPDSYFYPSSTHFYY